MDDLSQKIKIEYAKLAIEKAKLHVKVLELELSTEEYIAHLMSGDPVAAVEQQVVALSPQEEAPIPLPAPLIAELPAPVVELTQEQNPTPKTLGLRALFFADCTEKEFDRMSTVEKGDKINLFLQQHPMPYSKLSKLLDMGWQTKNYVSQIMFYWRKQRDAVSVGVPTENITLKNHFFKTIGISERDYWQYTSVGDRNRLFAEYLSNYQVPEMQLTVALGRHEGERKQAAGQADQPVTTTKHAFLRKKFFEVVGVDETAFFKLEMGSRGDLIKEFLAMDDYLAISQCDLSIALTGNKWTLPSWIRHSGRPNLGFRKLPRALRKPDSFAIPHAVEKDGTVTIHLGL